MNHSFTPFVRLNSANIEGGRHRTPVTMSQNDTNTVLNALLNNDFTGAVTAFDLLEKPSPLDDLLVGLACLSLNRPLVALEHLLAAQGQGLEDAAPLVAATYRQRGQHEQAQRLLEQIQIEKLTAFGQALRLREVGLLQLRNGQARAASNDLSEAFTISLRDPFSKRFRTLFAKSLCDAYLALGNDIKLLETIDYALERATPSGSARLYLDKAISLTHTGRFTEADEEFTLLESSQLGNPSMRALITYYKAHLERVRGLNISAAEGFTQAAIQAREDGQAEVEAFAEIGLTRIATMLDDEPLARAHLNRARARSEGVQLHAELGLAQGALLARLFDANAVRVLEAALEGFERLELERDVGLTHLHLAEAHLRLGDSTRARTHLVRAVDARHALGSGALFACELRALPAVFDLLIMSPNDSIYEVHRDRLDSRSSTYLQVLLEDWRTLESYAPAQVTLTTLGGPDLRLDGVRPRMESGLARTVTMLAFLADQGPSSVDDLIGAVFAEETHATSRQYIQNIRSSLKRTLPTLSVPFNEQSRRYSIKPVGVRFAWDVALVREALETGTESGLRRALALYTGAFLPRADSNWAFEIRHELQYSIGRLGLGVLQDVRAQGKLEACIDLAERLLEVNAVDVAIVLLLVEVLTEARGTAQARQRLGAAKDRFLHEIGDVPEDVLALETSPRMLAN
jgi:tetratricopeptide (TPR) repeat protein/DNA-binding SARP family transcriptional activator